MLTAQGIRDFLLAHIGKEVADPLLPAAALPYIVTTMNRAVGAVVRKRRELFVIEDTFTFSGGKFSLSVEPVGDIWVDNVGPIPVVGTNDLYGNEVEGGSSGTPAQCVVRPAKPSDPYTVEVEAYPTPADGVTGKVSTLPTPWSFVLADLSDDDTDLYYREDDEFWDVVIFPIILFYWSTCPWFANTDVRETIKLGYAEALGELEKWTVHHGATRRIITNDTRRSHQRRI